MSCREALTKLERSGVLDLPKPTKTYAFERAAAKAVDLEVPELCCSLEELGEVSVSPVSSRYAKESKVWFALMQRYHYLGSGPICGAQMRYLIRSARGYLGGLAFSSASWAVRCRDDTYIKWTEGARRAHLERVVNNNRFLILPTVHVPNLASHVLSLALSRLPDDWELRYGVRPVLVETFVDPRFPGACYKAANFTVVGQSAGRRDGRAKQVFVFPLSGEWQETLCQEPNIPRPRPEAPRHWAEEEFGSVRLYDDRLKARLYTIAQDFYDCPQANIPEASGSKARTMAAYRFFGNSKVTMEVVLTPHREATIERIKEHKVVLAPQDTTILDYSTHPMTEGLGSTGNAHYPSLGLILHDTLAFSEEGTPLGVVDAQCWARDPGERHKRLRRKELPIEQKESMKWLRSFRKVVEIQKLCPETMLVSIGDRESDIYELFLEAAQKPGPKLLVRAEKTRKRKVEEDFLWEFMPKQTKAGILKVHVPRRGSSPARDAWLDIRFAQVTLEPPKGHVQKVTIWAVYATEQGGPIQWMLLTTAGVQSLDDARKRVEWYSARWGIEVYHRTLKSGCRIKDCQLEAAKRLESCIAVDMVVAWRVYYLTMLGRETPNAPCTVFFKDVEWKALACFVGRTPVPPSKPPSISQAVFMLAGMGGHLGRKADGFPGTQTVWLGLVKLYAATQMYAILTEQHYPHPMESGP